EDPPSFWLAQRQILEDSIYVAVRRHRDVNVAGAEAEAGAAGHDAPGQERTAVDRLLEPVAPLLRDVEIEIDFDERFLLADELAHLQVTGVRSGFPVDVASAFADFVGSDAIEVVTAASGVGFEF